MSALTWNDGVFSLWNGQRPLYSFPRFLSATYLETYSTISLAEKISELEKTKLTENFNFIKPLFNNQEEYDEFKQRHDKDSVETKSLEGYDKPVYIGIDAGSTTIKFVVVGEKDEILFSSYQSKY